jgi:hypothetical protein
MPYIPYVVVPPATVPTGSVQGYTNGFFTAPNYTAELNQIAFQINALQFQFSGAALEDYGSAAACLSAIASNSSIIAANMGEINLELKNLNLSIGGVSNSINTSTKGLANISTHMAKQTVIATMVMNNDVKKAEFEKEVTNQAQVAAGQEKTVITPQGLIERGEQLIAEVGQSNALIAGTAFVSEQISNTATTAFTTSAQWVAESAVGIYVQEAYGNLEVAAIGLFSAEKAIIAQEKLDAKLKKLKAGG